MLTSLDVISIIGDIEDEFDIEDIEISDEDVLGMITVGNPVNYPENHAR